MILNKMLNMLTNRERNFLFNSLSSKSGNKFADSINFGYDLELYRYKNSDVLENLFFHFDQDDVLAELIKKDKEVSEDE